MKRHALLGTLLIFFAAAETASAGDHGALGVVLSSQQSGHSNGVTVTGILPGSPAAQAAIQPGDRILSVDGQQVADYHDVMRIVGAKKPDSQVRLDLARGFWRTTTAVSLGSSRQVFQQHPVAIPGSARPAWTQTVWPYPRPEQTSYPAERWRTHPRDDILTSLYNSDF